MKNTRSSDLFGSALELDLTIEDLMADLDPAWLAASMAEDAPRDVADAVLAVA